MFWSTFIGIIMVDMYLNGSEILRGLIIRNIFILNFFLECICRYTKCLAFSAHFCLKAVLLEASLWIGSDDENILTSITYLTFFSDNLYTAKNAVQKVKKCPYPIPKSVCLLLSRFNNLSCLFT